MLMKKDFNKVAEILREKVIFNDRYIRELTIRAFCKWFKSENPKFNEQKFREAVLKN